MLGAAVWCCVVWSGFYVWFGLVGLVWSYVLFCVVRRGFVQFWCGLVARVLENTRASNGGTQKVKGYNQCGKQ